MVLLGVFFCQQMSSQLIERSETALRESLRQEADHISYNMRTYLSMIDFVAADEDIGSALTRDYQQNYDMYIAYRDTIDPLLETVRILHPGLNCVTFYSNAGIYPHGTYLQSLEKAKNFPWYEKTISEFESQFTFSEDGKTLYVTRQVYTSSRNYTNLLVLSVDVKMTLGSLRNMYDDNFGILLLDKEDHPIYQYTKFSDPDKYDELPVEMIASEDCPGDYVMQKYSLDTPEWTVVLYRPVQEMRRAVWNIVETAILLILFSSVLVTFLGAKMAAMVVEPMTALSENMKTVEQGNYELTVVTDRNDEAGHLIQAFRAMVKQQNHLVNEVLYAKIACQEYEMRILQSQINPHFLYNALSLISGRALMRGQEDISQVAQLLSSFYRTLLNKGKPVVTIAGELENVKSYIAIQRMMHSDSFDVVYEVDPELLGYTMPNMLLQPLAENAILHGLDNKETPGKGILTISCYRDGEDILFKVMDNGMGMTEEQCKNIILEDSRGYGVKNVHQRVQLYFGQNYGLSYYSVMGRGSYALLRIGQHSEKEK